MNLSAVNKYIGTEWVYESNDCWAVFRSASLSVFGRPIPEVEIPLESNEAANAVLFDAHAGEAHWQPVAEPTPGCAVLCRDQRGNAVHIGLYVVDGNVLHCMGSTDRPGRTAYDELRLLRRLFKSIEFYSYVPDNRNT